jgi:hypothetical protein
MKTKEYNTLKDRIFIFLQKNISDLEERAFKELKKDKCDSQWARGILYAVNFIRNIYEKEFDEITQKKSYNKELIEKFEKETGERVFTNTTTPRYTYWLEKKIIAIQRQQKL